MDRPDFFPFRPVIALAVLCSYCNWAEPSLAAEQERTDPARVETGREGDAPRILLTERAFARLDITTQVLRTAASGQRVVPYASLLYDPSGGAWVYVNPEPLTFVRQAVVPGDVEGENTVLLEGPPTGTRVVAVGVSELYGIERGVGEE